ncbi:recombinase family protein [Corynebacterium suicordis]|uniref:Recombinase family protein n=1 Tax=Corynebacterium suicordis DSM 45110 TaxID=1121369 RepID=A0ABR9ZN72_9CORY|nr:recombinase family protein [Corynebacterium suicordis]MBF4554394.1 recombinase family protein [Corynebacterium suicordis DSM 45110]MDR6278581.1 DNA invertase Pin-like site-specific DNA recombinase [Corynebacterium suicordis]
MALLGYARVSTKDQDASLQIDALDKHGCTRIFTDTKSGVLAERPELTRLLDYAREGDTLVVWRLDRLGRSIKHLIEQVEELNTRKIEFQSLQENIDTTTAGGRLIFHLFSALAEFEHDLIVERTQAGLEAARARGRKGGRKPKLSPAQRSLVKDLYVGRKHTVQQIADMFDVNRATIYRTIHRSNQHNTEGS